MALKAKLSLLHTKGGSRSDFAPFAPCAPNPAAFAGKYLTHSKSFQKEEFHKTQMTSFFVKMMLVFNRIKNYLSRKL